MATCTQGANYNKRGCNWFKHTTMMPVFKKIIDLVTNFTSVTENASAASIKSSKCYKKQGKF